MRKVCSASALASALVLLYASSARATPVDDFRAGASVFVQFASAKIDDGEPSAGGYEFAKAAGSMAFDIDRAAFGLGAGAPIHVSVAQLDGDTVELSADHVFSPVGENGNIRVSHVVGKAQARVLSVHGGVASACESASCPYSVRVELLPGASLHVEGEAWKSAYGVGHWFAFARDASEIKGMGLGGVPRSPLVSFDLTAPEVECNSDKIFAERTYVGRVKIAAPATVDGAWVDVESSDTALFPPRRVFIPQGSDSATFALRFSATDGGLYAFRAASGGATVSKTISVRKCITHVERVRQYVEDRDILRTVCRPCLEGAKLTDRNFGVVWWPEGAALLAPDTDPVPFDKLVEGQLLEADVGPFGDVVGSLRAPSGELFGFRLRDWQSSPRLDLFPFGSSPLLSAYGTAFFVGYDDQQRASAVAYLRDEKREVPVPGSAYQVVGMTPSGEAVVNASDGGVDRAFAVGFDGPVEIKGPGEGLRVVSVGASGAMLAVTTGWQEPSRAVLLTGNGGEAIDLPGLPYAPWISAVGMDDDGVALVNGFTEDQRTVPYLVVAGEEPIELEKLVEGLDAQLLEAVSISPAGRITARALRDGEPTLVVLAPKNP